MSNTIIELKKLDIDRTVDQMKLSVLANHIVESLHEMTSKNSQVVAGECSASDTRLGLMTT
jgi:hypothetical protein